MSDASLEELYTNVPLADEERGEERQEDERTDRSEEIRARFSQPEFGAIRQILDESINHAAVTASVDGQEANRPWRALGPRNIGGRINALIQAPGQPSTFYAGSAVGGVWKTTDGGDTWQALDDFRPPNAPNNVPQALPVGAMALCAGSPNVLYVGTGDPTLWVNGAPAPLAQGDPYDLPGAGLFWSTDSGQTFNRIDHPDVGTGTIASDRFEAIQVDPWNSRSLWVASPTRGLWRGSPGVNAAAPPTFVQDVIDAPGIPAANQRCTDVVVDFGNPLGGAPNRVWIYCALWNQGIFRARFDRTTNAYIPNGAGQNWTNITPALWTGFAPFPIWRIKLAICRNQPQNIYAVGAIANERASNIMWSVNRGGAWVNTNPRQVTVGPPANQFVDNGRQASYDLVVSVDPNNPRLIVTGSVEMFRSIDGGNNWQRIINWQMHDKGDRAQHADQHALLFDHANPRRIWVGNDGGISMSPDVGNTWRERSNGILAGQFYDITSHPQHPYIMGGGLQDNGTWLGFGGYSWYHINGGDGGQIGFDPNNIRRLHSTWQGGLDLTTFRVNNTPWGTAATPDWSSPMPDRAVGGVVPNIESRFNSFGGFNANHPSTFVGVVATHPTRSNRVLIGRWRAIYGSTNGTAPVHLRTLPAVNGNADRVNYIHFSPSNPNNVTWTVSTQGQAFRTRNAWASWQNRAPAAARGHRMTAVAVHPQNDSIVAISVTQRAAAGTLGIGRVFLTGDDGANWLEISGRTAGLMAAGAATQLNPGSATAVTFDPASPAAAAGPHTLYVGTMAGVYVIRNAVAPAAAGVAFTPAWGRFSGQLPLNFIQDLEAIRFQDATPANKDLLRVATHGRGIWECDLNPANANPRLLIRDNVIQTGQSYNTTSADDPRIAAGANFVNHQAFDIRVDNELLHFVDENIDGVEFDERITTDNVALGAVNRVFVQAANTHATVSASATVYLYFAAATNATTAPDLPANFWDAGSFPRATAGAWTLAGQQTIQNVGSADPRVLKFRMTPPAGLGANIAILALISDPAADNLLSAAPSTTVATLVNADRRAALRILPTQVSAPDASLRDSFEQTGNLAIANWGARSNDILVKQGAAAATPNTAFADILDQHSADHVKGGVINRMYVRVHNRGGQQLTAADVHLYNVPLASLHEPANWVHLARLPVVTIAANGWSFANRFDLPAAAAVDPNPGNQPKNYLFAAVLTATGEDALPGLEAQIIDIPSFWRYFIQNADSNNAVLRGVGWRP